MFDTKTGQRLGSFTSTGAIKALSFSENGTFLASAAQGQTTATIWNLRKMTEIKTLDVGSQTMHVEWDYTGQYLAIAASGCVAVVGYNKGDKSWSELCRRGFASSAVSWGPRARSLVALGADGSIGVLKGQ